MKLLVISSVGQSSYRLKHIRSYVAMHITIRIQVYIYQEFAIMGNLYYTTTPHE